ncbi:MAG: SCO family protein, partial [Candidatus Dadabacteria bacterium]
LADQNGNTFALDSFRGKVVVLSSFYSRCKMTCPLILGRLKLLREKFTGKPVVFVAVTMDPDYDKVPVLKETAKRYGIDYENVFLLTGSKDKVNAVLDRYEVYRKRSENPAVIQHSNLIILIDKKGEVAYRFSLGAMSDKWLVKAVEDLIGEPI